MREALRRVRPTRAVAQGAAARLGVVGAGVAGVLALVLVVVLAALALAGPATSPRGEAATGAALIVRDVGADEVVAAREVHVGDEVELRHRHSVTRRPIRERFSVLDRERLALEELWFDAHGPNLPAGPDQVPPQAEWTAEDGAYRVIHPSTPQPSVPVATGSADVDHRVLLPNGEELVLLEHVEAGTLVELAIAPEPPQPLERPEPEP